jgi:hypothetical protein
LVEWQVCESDEEWDAAQRAGPAGLKEPVSHLAARTKFDYRQLALGAALLVLAAAGGWLWHTANAGLEVIEAEVEAAVTADLWPATHTPADVTLLDLDRDTAVVEVVQPGAADQPALRQTRVYQRSGADWVRSAPSASIWGTPRRLKTRFFVFEYYDRDTDAVKAAAAKLDALYRTLYAGFFPGAPPSDKRAIQVDPTHAPGDFVAWASRYDPLVVASPAVYLAPDAVTADALLVQSIVLILLEDLMRQVNDQYGVALDEYQSSTGLPLFPLLRGVHLWQLWATGLPLAQWREPMVQWIFSEGYASQDHPGVDPAFAPALCAMHRLWMVTPLQIQLPLTCRDRHSEIDSYFPPLHGPIPQHYAQTPLTYRYLLAGGLVHPATVVALAAMMEYAAATYGPERIPALLAATDEHSSWEMLIQAVFGVSAAEFEVGWQNYLAEHYAITVPTAD